jgi:hypothetical protein
MSAVGLALNLVPSVGIAFLRFICVVRDRLGSNDDRFFSNIQYRFLLIGTCSLSTVGAAD